MKKKYAFKVVLIGDGAVGKTSLVRRFVDQRFDDNYITTIGVNVKKKVIPRLDLALSIWDIFGQKSLAPKLHSKYYKGAKGALVVFDITRKSTFMDLDDWIKDLFKVTGQIPVYILANKIDLISDFQKEMKVSLNKKTQKQFHQYMVERHYVKSLYMQETEFVPVTSDDIRKWYRRKKFTRSSGCFLTSAKTGKNVENAFKSLGKAVLENAIKKGNK